MSTLETNPDYSEEFENKPLPLNLYKENDGDRDLWIKSRLESLINGSLQPSQLAIEIDSEVTEFTERKYRELVHKAEVDEDDLLEPPPRVYLSPFFSAIVQLFFTFPAYHPGQSSIVELLLALKALPRHKIYTGLPDSTVTLWPLGEDEGDWQKLWLYFHDEIFGINNPPIG